MSGCLNSVVCRLGANKRRMLAVAYAVLISCGGVYHARREFSEHKRDLREILPQELESSYTF